jgi:hypothetical protein
MHCVSNQWWWDFNESEVGKEVAAECGDYPVRVRSRDRPGASATSHRSGYLRAGQHCCCKAVVMDGKE